MKKLLTLFILAFLSSASAVDKITATLTLLTPTTNGMTLQIVAGNTTTRTWTNSVVVAATEVLTNAAATGSATNLYNHLLVTPPTGVAPIKMTTATNLVLYGQSGINLLLTPDSAWATATYTTQAITSARTVRVPYTVEPAAQQTNVASSLTTA